MTYLLDSDQIISYLNCKKEIVEKIDNLASEELFTSVICVAEVLEGIYGREKEKSRSRQFQEFLEDIPVLSVDKSIADKFAKLRSNLRKRGNLIENMDIFIAATALTHDLVLLTGNKKDFRRIANLKLYEN